MVKYVVARTSEIDAGQRKIVEVEGKSIGVFNVHGQYYALRNRCPHQGAPLCLGSIKGTALPAGPGEYVWAREGEILRCPWHGWEFDITTGQNMAEPDRWRSRSYPVTLETRQVETEAAEPDPAAVQETIDADSYPVTVEDEFVILHL